MRYEDALVIVKFTVKVRPSYKALFEKSCNWNLFSMSGRICYPPRNVIHREIVMATSALPTPDVVHPLDAE
jgi:hypothetical protein